MEKGSEKSVDPACTLSVPVACHTPVPVVSGTGEDKLLDFVARCPGDRDRSVGADLTVIATMAAKYLTPALAGTRARNSKPMLV